jgi:hypothetical protein
MQCNRDVVLPVNLCIFSKFKLTVLIEVNCGASYDGMGLSVGDIPFLAWKAFNQNTLELTISMIMHPGICLKGNVL